MAVEVAGLWRFLFALRKHLRFVRAARNAARTQFLTRDVVFYRAIFFPRLLGHRWSPLVADEREPCRSACISDPCLLPGFLGIVRPRRKLQNGRVLAVAEKRQQHDLAVGELERVVMRRLFVLVDLTKDRRAMAERFVAPRE